MKKFLSQKIAAALLPVFALSGALPASAAVQDPAANPQQALQWYLETVGQPTAKEAGLDGSGVTIAVIDSGCRLSHEDLAGLNVLETKDFVEDSDSIEDTAKHGTSVVGILAATADNGVGIIGLAPEADYMLLRAFSADGGKESAMISALSCAINAGADVINLSFGASDSERLTALQPIIDVANKKGCIVVASVGNSGKETLLYPAGCEGVIGVGSSQKGGEISEHSNYNESVDIVAPGENIYTLSAVRDDAYTKQDGTSFAAPMVSAMAAWAKQVDPDITGEEFLELLKATADDAGDPGYDTRYGWGIVNGDAFIAKLLEDYGQASDRFYHGTEQETQPGVLPGLDDTVWRPSPFTLPRTAVYTLSGGLNGSV